MERNNKVDILLAKEIGFCFGVNQAVKKVSELVKEKLPIYSVGEFIHNSYVINTFKKKGLRIISEEKINEIKQGLILIRTHGVGSNTYKAIKTKDVKIIDTTCPFVKKLQENMLKLQEENFQVIIIGNKNHPEIKALLNTGSKKTVVINNISETKKILNFTKLGIVVQTTYEFEKFKEFIYILLNKAKELKIYNTICDATFKRQQEAMKIAQKVDLMLVIGGKNSANTQCLFKLCKARNKKTYHIERAYEIQNNWLENIKNIGITGGTSTPQKIIKEVVKALSL